MKSTTNFAATTEWELIPKGPTRRGGYGDGWNETPAVAINKSGITFNGPFYREYGDGSKLVFLAIQQNKLGVKFVPKGDFNSEAYSCIEVKAKGANGSGAMRVNCDKIAKRFPDSIGAAFRPHQATNSQIIEIALTPGNRLIRN